MEVGMKRHSVGEVMTREVVTVRETTGYKEIVEALASHALSAVPVVDAEGHVLGIVSEADLLHKIEFAGFEPQARLLERKRVRVAREKAGVDLARDLMTAPVVVIDSLSSVAAAAKLMDAERVKRLPVVDADGRIVGIVSRRDLLKLYLRDDDDIRTEIRDEVLLRTMWIDPASISIEVDHGVVALAGELERRSTIPLFVRLVSSVAGVVDVVNNLSYRYDDLRVPGEEPIPIVA